MLCLSQYIQERKLLEFVLYRNLPLTVIIVTIPVAESYEIPIHYVKNINSSETLIGLDKQPDIIFCFGWSRLLNNGECGSHGSGWFSPGLTSSE